MKLNAFKMCFIGLLKEITSLWWGAKSLALNHANELIFNTFFFHICSTVHKCFSDVVLIMHFTLLQNSILLSPLLSLQKQGSIDLISYHRFHYFVRWNRFLLRVMFVAYIATSAGLTIRLLRQGYRLGLWNNSALNCFLIYCFYYK